MPARTLRLLTSSQTQLPPAAQSLHTTHCDRLGPTVAAAQPPRRPRDKQSPARGVTRRGARRGGPDSRQTRARRCALNTLRTKRTDRPPPLCRDGRGPGTALTATSRSRRRRKRFGVITATQNSFGIGCSLPVFACVSITDQGTSPVCRRRRLLHRTRHRASLTSCPDDLTVLPRGSRT